MPLAAPGMMKMGSSSGTTGGRRLTGSRPSKIVAPGARCAVWPGHRTAPEIVAPACAGSTRSRVFYLSVSPGSPSRLGGFAMDLIYSSVAGLDVHLKTITVAVRRGQQQANVKEEVRTFGTMTSDLLELSDWLAGLGVTHVAMEATGVLWKPIWNILEGRFSLLLVNPDDV